VWTTRVSNPVWYPHFRAWVSVKAKWAAYAIGVLDNIYAFHRYTINSAHLYFTQVYQFQWHCNRWATVFHHWLNKPPAHPLNPINPDNACTLRITAAAGTELAGAYSYSTVNASRKSRFFLYKSSLQRITPSSCTRHGWVRLASIAQYSLLLPPVGVWPVSQCQCGGLTSQFPYQS
jgi:hypothetical protein